MLESERAVTCPPPQQQGGAVGEYSSRKRHQAVRDSCASRFTRRVSLNWPETLGVYQQDGEHDGRMQLSDHSEIGRFQFAV